MTHRTCRTRGCRGIASERSGRCRPCVLRGRYYGNAETIAPNPSQSAELRRVARQIVAKYADRQAMTAALELAAQVYRYVPSHDFSIYHRAAHELEKLRDRADPREVLVRVVAAYLALDSDGYHFPDSRAARHHLGRVVLGELWQRREDGSKYRLTGRVVSEIGEHVGALLGVYGLAAVRQYEKDTTATRAAIARCTDFTCEEA